MFNRHTCVGRVHMWGTVSVYQCLVLCGEGVRLWVWCLLWTPLLLFEAQIFRLMGLITWGDLTLSGSRWPLSDLVVKKSERKKPPTPESEDMHLKLLWGKNSKHLAVFHLLCVFIFVDFCWGGLNVLRVTGPSDWIQLLSAFWLFQSIFNGLFKSSEYQWKF